LPLCAFSAAFCALVACCGWSGTGNTYRAPSVGKRSRFEATYRFGLPGQGWKPAAGGKGVQVAWRSAEVRGVIGIHSQCEEHGDSSLDQFTDHLRIDWTRWKVISEREERLVGRAALRSIVEAELDGVKFKHELVIVKKSGCLFDLRYSARPESFERGRAAFQRVVAGFEFPVR
jgi:hypothetical protein